MPRRCKIGPIGFELPTIRKRKGKETEMKKITAILLALVMILSLAACGTAASTTETTEATEAPAEAEAAAAAEEETAQGGTLVFATSADYAPFEFIVLDENNEQKYVGIDVSVAQAIADDMGMELQVVNMDFDSLMANLQKGDADIVLAAIEVTEERLEAADFSDPYYTDLPAMILVKADKAEEYTSVESFSGKSVGAQTGTTKVDIVNETLTGANLVALTSVNDLVNQLVYDKVDAIVVDGAVAMQYAQANSDLVVADVSLGEAAPFCVAVQKGDPKGLLTSINATIAKLLADGSIDTFAAEADALSDQAIA